MYFFPIALLLVLPETLVFKLHLPRFYQLKRDSSPPLEGILQDTRKNSEVYEVTSTKLKQPRHISSIPIIRKPEILAPAGGWAQLKAAAISGANACYFGLEEGFNARARASNFCLAELDEVMTYLHDRGMKGYLTMNVLVFDKELQNFQSIIRKVAESGVDALIMQDVGAISYVRRLTPNLPIHASTQMSITDGYGTMYAHRLGIDRVVVGRELSIRDIKTITKSCGPVEIEAFVHGALCVSYSGQCYSSEAWGGRSANRGQCAQACRLPYGLIVNGTLTELRHDVQYLLSPQDLMAVDYVPQLIDAGVSSFKIEGRLKGPEYVAITTKAYRDAIDEVWDKLMASFNSSHSIGISPANIPFVGPGSTMRRDLKQVFSRGQDEIFSGLSSGYLTGVHHQSVVRGNSPRHRGVYVGKVAGVLANGDGVIIDLDGPIKRGDGIVFDRGDPEDKEEGGSVYEVFVNKKSVEKGQEVTQGRVRLTFGRNAINYNQIFVGDRVWRNKDPALDGQLKDMLNKYDTGLVPVIVKVSGELHKPLIVSIQPISSIERLYYEEIGVGPEADDGIKEANAVMEVGIGATNSTLSVAEKKAIDLDDISKVIGSLGGTPFRVQSIDISDLESNTFIPMSEVKAARRVAIENLVARRRKHRIADDMALDSKLLTAMIEEARTEVNLTPNLHLSTPVLSVLCRTPLQVYAACEIEWLNEIVLDFLEVHGIRDAVRTVQQSGKTAIVATPRVIKPEEEKLIYFYLRLRADAILVRSAGILEQLLQLGGPGAFSAEVNTTIPRLLGDFSLNVANALSACTYLKSGLDRITPTHDCNADQIIDIQSLLQTDRLEVILHQHLAIFHTEHCVFCRFLSAGNNYTDCGHPCERNHVELRSMEGQDHLVLADQGCRNTVFNAQAQTGAEFLPRFVRAGVMRYRVELVDESPESVSPLLNWYKRLLDYSVGATYPNAANGEYSGKLLSDFYKFLGGVRNGFGSGKTQGYSAGSLLPSSEMKWDKMKATAYQGKP